MHTTGNDWTGPFYIGDEQKFLSKEAGHPLH